MTLAENVARFSQNVTYESLPEAVKAKAKGHILDTIGVLIAATDDNLMNILAGFLDDLGSGSNDATILGNGRKTEVSTAALINGTLSHGLDYDDSSWKLIGHPSAAVLPAVLALAEKLNSSGKDILTAYVVGVEVLCKLGAKAEPNLYQAGWHATGVAGVLGATVASTYLLKLTEAQTSTALGIAASMAAGLRQNFGTLTKPFHAGAAARNGITAALLAKNGFTSNLSSLEGAAGFFHNFATGTETSSSDLNFGAPYDVDDPGFFVKPFPCCAATHTGIEATLNLVNKYDLKPENVAKVSIGSGPVGPIMLVYHQPNAGFEGKFSMPFTAAMAIKYREVGLNCFTDANVNDPVVKNIIANTEFGPDPKFADRSIDEAPAIVTITTTDGKEYTECVEEPLGSPKNPMSTEDLCNKFKDCAKVCLSENQINEAINLLLNLENVKTYEELLKTLVPKN
ncbi:MmgE/PrpD family protein [Selenomonadales bacterium OttesenSCG-928-I06]|nr:MmgE/PrpD family protein [Selenomonadales bacterium OttesenSCG-928-I06]